MEQGTELKRPAASETIDNSNPKKAKVRFCGGGVKGTKAENLVLTFCENIISNKSE